jgi:murein DD-endopeptidase MepM/ murein hydrolase activator NlpD
MTTDNLTTFALLGAGGAFATAAFTSRRAPTGERNLSAPLVPAGVHVVPVPMFGEYAPTLSNEYAPAKGHLGVDLMYRRKNPGDQLARYPLRTPNGARDFFLPDGTRALAAGDGVVRFADWTPRGWSVIVDHADGASTYYTHLEVLSVVRTSSSKGAQRVTAGQLLGVIGSDPLDAEKLKHLHFELWLGRSRSLATDPGPYIAQWPRVRLVPR